MKNVTYTVVNKSGLVLQLSTGPKVFDTKEEINGHIIKQKLLEGITEEDLLPYLDVKLIDGYKYILLETLDGRGVIMRTDSTGSIESVSPPHTSTVTEQLGVFTSVNDAVKAYPELFV